MRVRKRLTHAVLALVLILAGSSNAQQDSGRHSLFTRLLQRYVENGLVDYGGFAADSSFNDYLAMLATTPPESLKTRDERLALWLNAYNAYTIKLIIDKSPVESIKDIGLGLPVLFGPWSISFANVGGIEYSLNEIEHDIIREKFADPRIHFALVCASRSCPKLRWESYEGPQLDRQLEDDARRFVNDSSLNIFNLQEGTVSLSKIFDWYESDFEKEEGGFRNFVSKYVESPQARDLLRSPETAIEFLPYDWSLNGRK